MSEENLIPILVTEDELENLCDALSLDETALKIRWQNFDLRQLSVLVEVPNKTYRRTWKVI